MRTRTSFELGKIGFYGGWVLVDGNAYRYTTMRKILLLILMTGVLNLVHGQVYYRGLERICWENSRGTVECYDAPRKWYHENTILIEKDSIFIYKRPLRIVKGKKLYSASDGAFYYYYGVISNIDTPMVAYLTSYNCDYCARQVRFDTLTGYQYPEPSFQTFKIKLTDNSIQIGKTIYNKLSLEKLDFFPSKSFFYLDSNSIVRQNPKGQYKLISQGIKNFLQTKDLKLDDDTLRICVDRFDDYEGKNLIETLDQNLIEIDSSNLILKFYTNRQLKELQNTLSKPIRVIKINEIIDYWKAARITLTYKIILPNNIRNFSEREYSNLFEYNKIRQHYELIGNLPENGWVLVEKR